MSVTTSRHSWRPSGDRDGGAAFDMVVDVLAAYRLTRLATADIISEPARQTAVTQAPSGVRPCTGNGSCADSRSSSSRPSKTPTKLARLITCRWCAGVWIAGAVIAATPLPPEDGTPSRKAWHCPRVRPYWRGSRTSDGHELRRAHRRGPRHNLDRPTVGGALPGRTRPHQCPSRGRALHRNRSRQVPLAGRS